MGNVTSHPLANQAEAYLFGRSLNTSLCKICDDKAAFLLVKTVLQKISISIYGKDIPIL